MARKRWFTMAISITVLFSIISHRRILFWMNQTMTVHLSPGQLLLSFSFVSSYWISSSGFMKSCVQDFQPLQFIHGDCGWLSLFVQTVKTGTHAAISWRPNSELWVALAFQTSCLGHWLWQSSPRLGCFHRDHCSHSVYASLGKVWEGCFCVAPCRKHLQHVVLRNLFWSLLGVLPLVQNPCLAFEGFVLYDSVHNEPWEDIGEGEDLAPSIGHGMCPSPVSRWNGALGVRMLVLLPLVLLCLGGCTFFFSRALDNLLILLGVFLRLPPVCLLCGCPSCLCSFATSLGSSPPWPLLASTSTPSRHVRHRWQTDSWFLSPMKLLVLGIPSLSSSLKFKDLFLWSATILCTEVPFFPHTGQKQTPISFSSEVQVRCWESAVTSCLDPWKHQLPFCIVDSTTIIHSSSAAVISIFSFPLLSSLKLHSTCHTSLSSSLQTAMAFTAWKGSLSPSFSTYWPFLSSEQSPLAIFCKICLTFHSSSIGLAIRNGVLPGTSAAWTVSSLLSRPHGRSCHTGVWGIHSIKISHLWGASRRQQTQG